MMFSIALYVLTQLPFLNPNAGTAQHKSCFGTTWQSLQGVLPHLEEIQRIGGTVGMSVGVMSHGEELLRHDFGFADLEAQTVANETTRYPLGSLTKAFVSATIAQLVREGTLRTGLVRLDALWLGAHNEVIVAKNSTIAVCNHLSPVYPLRSKWLYNNWMYALAGEVIERVTQKPWGQVLEERVLEKIGLSQTSVIGHRIPPNSTALPYVISDSTGPLRIEDVGLQDGHIMSSAGGVRSTVHDMLNWGNELLSVFREEQNSIEQIETLLSGQSFMNKSAISDELYALAFGKVTTPAQFGKMGFNPSLMKGGMPTLGTHSAPQRVFYHNGAIPGYNYCIMLLPDQQTVIVDSQIPSPKAILQTGLLRHYFRLSQALESPWT